MIGKGATPVTPKVPPTVAASDNVVAPVTPKVPPTVAASDNVVTPVTPNVPPTAVLPLAAATVNLSVFTAMSLAIPPEANNLFVTVKSFATVVWSENVASPVTPNVPPTVAASVNVVTPVTPSVPATAVFPVAAATVNLFVFTATSLAIPPAANNLFVTVKSFVTIAWSENVARPPTPSVELRVVAPVTPNVSPTVVAPDTPNVPPTVALAVTARPVLLPYLKLMHQLYLHLHLHQYYQ